MAKVMLVEDDNNLREIYGARLQAEGYEIVSAKDGEEALALAVQEKPDLIISDVMMPRISGFDMLDILRNAPETKNTKVIMMTALSQAEDKSRADKLGADRYLVKSQVTLEDVANVVHEVLEGTPVGDNAPAPQAPAMSEPIAAPQPEPLAPAPVPAPVPAQPAPETVEALANPVVEVHDEPDPSQVQAPPQEMNDPVAATQPAPAPAPEPSNTAPIAPASAQPPISPQPVITADNAPEFAVKPIAQAPPTTSTSTSSTSDDTALPPIVEPAAPIKVELPQAATTPTPSAPVTPQAPEQPASDFIGPNLAEALASEGAAQAPQVTGNQIATPAMPTVTNGAPSSTIIEPTVTAPNPEVSTAEETSGVETNNNVAGMRIIQPLSDPTATPDINELLANEQRKAAVANPTANTVITPETPSSQPTPAPAPSQQQDLSVKQPPKNDDFNNIAL